MSARAPGALRRIFQRFPLGTAPLAMLLIFLVCAVQTSVVEHSRAADRPDLTFTTFSQLLPADFALIAEFERRHGVHVQVEQVAMEALESRLQSALLAGSEVPDVVELVDSSFGYFTQGPIADVGFVDLTGLIRRDSVEEQIVASRLALWSTRGHVFALPEDVEPLVLSYRRDLVEALGIDVSQLDTWPKFAEMARKVSVDRDGDGIIDRYAIDFPLEPWGPKFLLAQREQSVIDKAGNVTIDSPVAVEVVDFYVGAISGPGRFSYPVGYAASRAHAMLDGLVLFYPSPDWELSLDTKTTPQVSGKMAVMPLPAWEPGGKRVGTRNGSGLAITKQSKNPELAWKFLKYLALDPEAVGKRFSSGGKVPVVRSAWTLPQLLMPDPFYSGQRVLAELIALAPQVPAVNGSPYRTAAEDALIQAVFEAKTVMETQGPRAAHLAIPQILARHAERVRKAMQRNVFYAQR